MLEPTGNIKKAQEKAARAFGADHVFFVTNGTSTSNKMAVQALLAPGDIAIVDRNCHKSHHYGMVLAGAQPLYVEAFPMTEYSMYGAVPLKHDQSGAARPEGRWTGSTGSRWSTSTNCTFEGHIYNTRRVMEECLAIKPDLIFLWDEAWFGFARFSPFLRPRTAMGAANDIEGWLRDPKSIAAYEKHQAQLGNNPSDELLFEDSAHPRSARGQAECLSEEFDAQIDFCLLQGSILFIKEVEFHTRRVSNSRKRCSRTHRPVPNQPLIASLHVARQRIELERFGSVTNAMEIALGDPSGSQQLIR